MTQYNSQGFAAKFIKSEQLVAEKSKQDCHPVKISQAKHRNTSSKFRSNRPCTVRVIKKTTRKRKAQIVSKQTKKTPNIPRKVLRVLNILRHVKFLQVVARYFKPLRNKIIAPICNSTETTIPNSSGDFKRV